MKRDTEKNYYSPNGCALVLRERYCSTICTTQPVNLTKIAPRVKMPAQKSAKFRKDRRRLPINTLEYSPSTCVVSRVRAVFLARKKKRPTPPSTYVCAIISVVSDDVRSTSRRSCTHRFVKPSSAFFFLFLQKPIYFFYQHLKRKREKLLQSKTPRSSLHKMPRDISRVSVAYRTDFDIVFRSRQKGKSRNRNYQRSG